MAVICILQFCSYFPSIHVWYMSLLVHSTLFDRRYVMLLLKTANYVAARCRIFFMLLSFSLYSTPKYQHCCHELIARHCKILVFVGSAE
jgi:hypothetical protein